MDRVGSIHALYVIGLHAGWGSSAEMRSRLPRVTPEPTCAASLRSDGANLGRWTVSRVAFPRGFRVEPSAGPTRTEPLIPIFLDSLMNSGLSYEFSHVTDPGTKNRRRTTWSFDLLILERFLT